MSNPPPSPRLFRDPWAKREAWRKHPVFQYQRSIGKAFPGLFIAIGAFTGYVLVDNFILTPSSEHH